MKKTFTKLTLLAAIFGFFITKANALPPTAQFNASTYNGCAPLTVTFYNSSAGNGNYSWNFGDPSSGIYNTSIACSPTHTFVNAGSYTVTMTYVLGPNTYTATATITVYPRPNPVISGKDTVCEGETQVYTVSGMAGSSFYWTINGGSIMGSNTGTSVTVNWSVPGTGILAVKETTSNGCVNTGKLNVLVANQPQIGNICDLNHQGGSGQPDKDRKSCLCQYNISTIQAIDIYNQLMSNQLYNFQWTVLSGGSVYSGGNTNTVQLSVGAGPTITVQLVAWNDFGCRDTQICIFDVCPSPHASFKADTACLTGTTHFNAGASTIGGQITNYHWNFGDNSQTNTNIPTTTHTYAAAGVYNVKLTVKYATGCTDDTVLQVLVNNGTPPPIYCPGTVCHNTQHCYNTPYYAGASYTWTITGGVGTPSANGDSICVVWGNGPNGNITLNVTGGPYTCGYNSIDVPVFPANLQILGPDTICNGATSQFSVPLIPGSCYSWLPSNPNITIANNPGNIINIYVPPGVTGTFSIIADVKNDITCCSGRDTHTFVVQGPIQIDTAQDACEFSTHTYTSNVPVTWSVSGGGIQTSSPTSVTIVWGSAGTGVINATAINPNLVCKNSVTVFVNLVPLPPNPPINGPTVLCVGSTATYSYVTSPNIAGSAWSISPFAVQSPSGNVDVIQFTTPGTYTLTSTYYNSNYNISGPFSCYSQSQLTILVVDTVCPVITGNAPSCIGKTETYTIPSNPGNIWQWSVIGGNVLSQTPTSVQIQWGNINQGQVSVQNTVCSKLCTKFVTINAIPTGTITLGDSTCKGDTIRLYGPPGYTYQWNTGGTNSSLNINSTGLYYLIITQAGCKDTIYRNINPIPKKAKPNVNIAWNCMVSPTTPIPYYMQATYNASWSYQWTPQTSTPANADTTFQHYSTTYNSTHTVVVTNQFGCKDTASVTLNQTCTTTGGGGGSCTCTPTITWTYDPCYGQFNLSITGQPYSAVYWNFSDGDYSNYLNPQHWFSDTGIYNVTIGVLCSSGCWTSITAKVYVPYILRPKIQHAFPVTCNYNFISLSYKSTSVVKGQSVSYSTDWGDGGPLTTGILPKTHNYTLPGTYIIQHTVSVPGCSKTVNDTVVIKPFMANFGFCDSGCVGEAIQFVDQSTSWSPIVHWNWTFGDATNSNLQSPFHIYNSTGTFAVQLIIQNQQGCKDTANYNVNVTTFNPGSLTFTVNGTPATGSTFTICDGGYVTATAPFSVNYTYAWNDGKFGNKDTIKTSGVYWCIITNAHGCTKKLGPFTVIVNPNPNATILAADSMCSAYNMSLLALNGMGYNWNWSLNPGALTTTGNPGVFSSVPPGNYTSILTVSNAFGCKANDTLLVHWLPTPIVTVNPTFSAICEGTILPITASVAGPYTSFQWNTGQNTLNINVFASGFYTAYATDANGCVGSAMSYIIVNPKPDLSNIPKGCYEVCKTETGVATVCGPIALPGESFTYNWLLNGTTVSTNQNIVLNSPGNYQLIVTNTVTGCIDTSDIFSVTFVSGPVAQIGSSSPNPTICTGSGACITLTALNAQNNVLYTWIYNNNWFATGTSIQACNPGTYILHAFRSHCCESWDTIIIDEGDCCFDPHDSDFHLIQDGTVYTTTQWWDGKYFVAGKVYVRNKAVLDMSTIDVVFDRDGEIIFEDSSTIRANNSVFRPCDMHDVWVGFTFKDSSNGFIHTCLYKNAMHAIDVKTTGPDGVKMTDNTFTDCNIGIRVDRSGLWYNQGITHNSFVLSNYDFVVKGLYPTYDNFGIILRSVRMEEIVTQNDFRNSDRASQPNRYFGIYMLRSLANLSENRFSDMYRSIDVTSNVGLVNVENNEIEKNFQGKFSSDVQIRFSDCNLPVLAFANELRNADNKYNKSVAIFAERMNSLNIRDNNIKGFDVGIWTRRTNGAVINENDIDEGGEYGILDSFSRKIDINCNIIRLKDCQKSGMFSVCNTVGIQMMAGDNSNDIFTNCIFDTRRAIHLLSMGTAIPIPNVVNNYMYNYQVAGVASVGHVGGIGFAGQPGRNTFVSNNRGGGALDITCFPPFTVSEQCNFGILLNGQVVTNACPPNTMYSSTAACGHQIVNQKFYKLDKWDICDNYYGPVVDIIDIDHGGSGGIGIKIDSLKLGPGLVKKLTSNDVTVIAMVLMQNASQSMFDNWLTLAGQENKLTSFEIEVLKSKWMALNVNYSAAVISMQNAIPTSNEEQQLKSVLIATWQQASGTKLSVATLQEMQSIDEANSNISPEARDVLHGAIAEHDYKFGEVPNLGGSAEPGAIGDPYVHIIPNPATQFVHVEFNIEGSADARLTVHDITGHLMTVSTISVAKGVFKVDVSNLSKGVYFVTVYDTETKQKHVAKLIKQ